LLVGFLTIFFLHEGLGINSILEGLVGVVPQVLGELHILEVHLGVLLGEHILEGEGNTGLHQQDLRVLPLAAEGVLVNHIRANSNCWCFGPHLA
jgi:hypothetical protein